MSKIQSYLSKKEHDRFLKICEVEGCTPYMMAKMTLLDKIHGYPLKDQDSEQSGEPEKVEIPEKNPKAIDAARTETLDSPERIAEVKTANVAEEVKEILERKPV